MLSWESRIKQVADGYQCDATYSWDEDVVWCQYVSGTCSRAVDHAKLRKPWFLQVNFVSPHPPFILTPSSFERLPDAWRYEAAGRILQENMRHTSTYHNTCLQGILWAVGLKRWPQKRMWWKAFCHRIRPQNFAQELHGKLPLAIDAEFNETLVPWEQFVKPICCQHPTSTKSQSVSFNLCSMCMVRSRLSNAGLWQLHQAQNSEELYEGVCERVLQPFAVALLRLFCTPSMTIILTMERIEIWQENIKLHKIVMS